MNILLIEDSAEHIQFAIKTFGDNIDCAMDAENALNFLRLSEYDLIICDLELPQQEGDEPNLETGFRLIAALQAGLRKNALLVVASLIDHHLFSFENWLRQAGLSENVISKVSRFSDVYTSSPKTWELTKSALKSCGLQPQGMSYDELYKAETVVSKRLHRLIPGCTNLNRDTDDKSYENDTAFVLTPLGWAKDEKENHSKLGHLVFLDELKKGRIKAAKPYPVIKEWAERKLRT